MKISNKLTRSITKFRSPKSMQLRVYVTLLNVFLLYLFFAWLDSSFDGSRSIFLFREGTGKVQMTTIDYIWLICCILQAFVIGVLIEKDEKAK